MEALRDCQVCAKPATHFCVNDEAFLCEPCNRSIHSANVLASKHKVMSISEYLQARPGFSQTSPVASCAEDRLTGSEGVVPVLDLPAEPAKAPALSEFEFFDFGDSWMDKFDGNTFFDFSDVMTMSAETEGLGLVPTMSEPFRDGVVDHKFPAIPSMMDGYELKIMSDDEEEEVALPTMQSLAADAEDEELTCVPVLPAPPRPAPVPRAAHGTFQMPAPVVKVSRQQAAINRAERVALFRQKKKSRKFEKTIRYASRKAYAEVRPRIKGRFAKPGELLALQQASTIEPAPIEDDDAVVPCF